MEIALHDPTYVAPAEPRASDRVALRFIHDVRDVPFLKLMALLTVTLVPTGVVLFVPGAFSWWLAVVHLALVVWFMPPFTLMLHNTSHRRLFKRPWSWMNSYIPWVLGPFIGETPETYFAHHVGMHHPENNLEDDISTTMPFVRDRFIDFMRYFLRFFAFALVDLVGYFAKKRRRGLMIRCIVGELGFFAAVAGLAFYDWRATLAVFIVPFVVSRFAMMAGNWGQHAFIDRASPENNYRNSITCINAAYNRRCFNDGYHIGHHIKQTRHWTEMPEDFARNIDTYAKEDAIVFRGIDFFGVWLCLMLKRYDWLARRFVYLGGAERAEDEVIALMRSRTQWTNVEATSPAQPRAGAL
jgi:hypothetical protein